MNGLPALLQVQDMDLLIGEMDSTEGRAALARMGFQVGDDRVLRRQRLRTFAAVDRRWQRLYERSQLRYGRGVVGVRDRVCQGCRITLPTSAAPGPGVFLTVCESCARILYWG